MPKFFDDPDEWFNGTTVKTKKSKGAGGGFTRTSYRKPLKTNYVKSGVNSITASNNSAKKLPQVMVKISGSSKGCDKAQAHANYIGRKGEVEIEDEQGIKYKGDEQKDLLKSWEAMGIPAKDKEGRRKEAFHIVFSMPSGTNPDAMKSAVKNLVQEEFTGHKYFLAQHLDTDNPHCHVLLSVSDDRGARLNPRKKDLHNYRVRFVEKLAEQGIEATASRRVHRFKYQDSKSQSVYHRDKRTRIIESKPTVSQKQKISETHKRVLNTYENYAKTGNADAETKKAIDKLAVNMKDKGRGR